MTSTLASGIDVQYLSQTSFPNGQLACGSIAYHWALACVHRLCKPAPSPDSMKELMQHAIGVHVKIAGDTGHSMLMIVDLLEHLGTPRNTKCREIFITGNSACARDEPQKNAAVELEDCIICHISQLSNCMTTGSALVFTAHRHTTALFLDQSNRLFCFDSLSGVVLKRTLGDMEDVLRQFHNLNNAFEACALLITVDNLF